MLHTLGPGNLVCANTDKSLTSFTNDEAISVHECTENTLENLVQIFLGLLCTLHEAHIRKGCKFLGPRRIRVASEDANRVSITG